MKRKQKSSKIKVFFDASILLSGLYSPRGASGELLRMARERKILGYVSDFVIQEVERNLNKFGLKKEDLRLALTNFETFIFGDKLSSEDYYKFMYTVDSKDIHLFIACDKLKVDYLVSLDKKHILSLRNKVKFVKISTPGELLMKLKR